MLLVPLLARGYRGAPSSKEDAMAKQHVRKGKAAKERRQKGAAERAAKAKV